MNDRQRLEAIVAVVCQYLPPDGISKEEAMREIISLVDPLPEKGWIGLTDEERCTFVTWLHCQTINEIFDAIEAILKERNT